MRETLTLNDDFAVTSWEERSDCVWVWCSVNQRLYRLSHHSVQTARAELERQVTHVARVKVRPTGTPVIDVDNDWGREHTNVRSNYYPKSDKSWDYNI